MAHYMTVTLSDQEYDALKVEAAKKGKSLETLLHEIMMRQFQPPIGSEVTKRPLTGREFMELQYREGKLLNIPTRRHLTQEEQTRRRRLAKAFAEGKTAADMVIEDRGPY